MSAKFSISLWNKRGLRHGMQAAIKRRDQEDF